MHILRLNVPALDRSSADRFESAAAAIDRVARIDTWRGRAEIRHDGADETAIFSALQAAGFDAERALRSMQVAIDGMTCRSCELTIERKLKKVPGVVAADVDASKGVASLKLHGAEPEPDVLQRALGDGQYVVLGSASSRRASKDRPSVARLAGLFGAVLLLGFLLSKLGLFKNDFNVGDSTTFFGALLLGLVAGSSSCMAVSGGLLLSSATKYRERYGGTSMAARLRPVSYFIAGRVLAYGVLGGLIGLIGSAITPSPLVTGGITLLAAAYMVVMGLDMLGIAPAWLKGLMPKMPKALGRRVMDAEEREHPAMPMVLGGATFFIPCGFTQALQLYALTTGSAALGASILAGFAVGTAPALFALGWASSSLKGKAGALFFQFSGALVMLLGLWNVQNGFTIAGYPLSMPDIGLGSRAVAADAIPATELPPIVDGEQVIRMVVSGPGAAYAPDRFVVRAGVPVRWEIDQRSYGGCLSVVMSRSLGIYHPAEFGESVIEFTPEKTGDHVFSCSMGMFKGTIVVVPNA